jgi:hypothetical protein
MESPDLLNFDRVRELAAAEFIECGVSRELLGVIGRGDAGKHNIFAKKLDAKIANPTAGPAANSPFDPVDKRAVDIERQNGGWA